MYKYLRFIAAVIVFAVFSQRNALAQFSGGDNGTFKSDAFSQSYVDENDTTGRDTTDRAFTFKEFFGGIKHKTPARIGVMFAGSTVFVGGMQAANKDYWKIPVSYGGIAACTGLGFVERAKWKDTGESKYQHLSNYLFAGAGLVYWGTLMDGIACFNKGTYPQAGKATLFALLCPGLGQVYNHEYWKVPLYYGLLLGGIHYLDVNTTNYKRFQKIYREATAENSTYTGQISSETALYYRDLYRRYRDYSLVAVAGFYLLQVIDANVFAYMHDFELNDDVTVSFEPAVVQTDNQYAMGNTGVGLSLGIRF